MKKRALTLALGFNNFEVSHYELLSQHEQPHIRLLPFVWRLTSRCRMVQAKAQVLLRALRFAMV